MTCPVTNALNKKGLANEASADQVVESLRRVLGKHAAKIQRILSENNLKSFDDLVDIAIAETRFKERIKERDMFREELVKKGASAEELAEYDAATEAMRRDYELTLEDVPDSPVHKEIFAWLESDRAAPDKFSADVLTRFVEAKTRLWQRLLLKHDAYAEMADLGILRLHKKAAANAFRNFDSWLRARVVWDDPVGIKERGDITGLKPLDYMISRFFKSRAEQDMVEYQMLGRHISQGIQGKFARFVPMLKDMTPDQFKAFYYFMRRWRGVDRETLEVKKESVRPIEQKIAEIEGQIKEARAAGNEALESQLRKQVDVERARIVTMAKAHRGAVLPQTEDALIKDLFGDTGLPELSKMTKEQRRLYDQYVAALEADNAFWEIGNQLYNMGVIKAENLMEGYIPQLWDFSSAASGMLGGGGIVQPVQSAYFKGLARTKARKIKIVADEDWAANFEARAKEGGERLLVEGEGENMAIVMPFSQAVKDGLAGGRKLVQDFDAIVAKGGMDEAFLVGYGQMFKNFLGYAESAKLPTKREDAPLGWKQLVFPQKWKDSLWGKRFDSSLTPLGKYYLPPEIADFVNHMISVPRVTMDIINTGTRWWKKSHTVWNFATHGRQFLTNYMILAPLAGHYAPSTSLWRAFKMIQQHADTDFMRWYMEEGGLLTDFFSSDLAKFMPDLKKKPFKEPGEVMEHILKFKENVAKYGRSADKFLAKSYMYGDQVFRLMHAMKYLEKRGLLKKGDLPTTSMKGREAELRLAIREAVRDTDRYFPNYTRTPWAVNKIANVVPFIKFDYEIMRLMANRIGDMRAVPGMAMRGEYKDAFKAVMPALLIAGMFATYKGMQREMAEAYGIEDVDRYLAMKSKADTGLKLLMPPFMAALFGSKNPITLDLTYIAPFGDYFARFEPGQGMEGNILDTKDYLVDRLMSHPLFDIGEIAMNRRFPWGTRITDPNDPLLEHFKGVATQAAYTSFPTWLTMLARDYAGLLPEQPLKNRYGGERRQSMVNLASFAGLRLEEAPATGQMRYVMKKYGDQVTAIKSNITRLKNDRAKGVISDDKFRHRLRIEQDKYRALLERGAIHGAPLFDRTTRKEVLTR